MNYKLHNLNINQDMNIEKHIALDIAKTKTYATGEVTKILDDGANEFTYSEDNLTYRDRYYGALQFLGEEVLY